MRCRCRNPRDKSYHSYGGRGIACCERWDLFENFHDDMGPCPAGASLERIDNNDDYCPENCRWATPLEQGRNKRNNHILTFRGESKCLTAWAEEMGLDYRTLLARLRAGWTVERALTTKVAPRRAVLALLGQPANAEGEKP